MWRVAALPSSRFSGVRSSERPSLASPRRSACPVSSLLASDAAHANQLWRASHSPTTCMYRSRSSTCGVRDDSSNSTHSAPWIPLRSTSCSAGVASSKRPETRSVGRSIEPSRSFDCQSLDRTDHMELARPVHRLVDGRVALYPRERLHHLGWPRVETAKMARIEDLARLGVRRVIRCPPPRDAARSPRPRAGARPEADSPQRRSPGTKRPCRRARATCSPGGLVKAYS